MKEKSGATSFFSGVAILTIANLLTKVIGLLFKIPLTNMLGDEGMGYFNTAYQIYSWLYMLSTAGLPVALSLMISECNAKGNRAESSKILRLTVLVFGSVGVLGSALMLVLNRQLAAFISADAAYICILAIAPAFFFVCVSSSIRGYFQGQRNMVPTAVSEVIEAGCKLGLGIFLGGYAISKGLPLNEVAAYAILGVSSGVAAGAVFLVLARIFAKSTVTCQIQSTESPRSSSELLGTFMKIALPIMLASSLLSMSSMLDTVIVIRRLKDTGISEEGAMALYGNYTAFCVTLFNLPPVLIYPIVNTLVPSMTAARVNGDREKAAKLMQKSLKLSAVIALPCAFGLGVLSEPVLRLIFSNEASAKLAAPLLSTLAPSIFLIAVMAVTNGVLQAFRLQKLSVLSMLCGALVKGVSAYILVGLPLFDGYLHMYGAPISTFLFYLTITVMNTYFIVRHTGMNIAVGSLFTRPLIASIACALTAQITMFGMQNFSSNTKFSTVVAIALAAVIYVLVLLLIGGIEQDDFYLVPKGKTLYRLLYRIRLVR